MDLVNPPPPVPLRRTIARSFIGVGPVEAFCVTLSTVTSIAEAKHALSCNCLCPVQLRISVMSIVNVTNVSVLNNPTKFDNPFQEMCDVVPDVTGLFKTCQQHNLCWLLRVIV